MPPQHVEIAETLSALRRKLKRDKEGSATQPNQSATNRGNKLKKGARYIHAGSLPYKYGPTGYKEKIEHAGFTRYILDRNPKRYNDYGDELDDSESDPEADADAEEENPYGEIKLEELLRPLIHPAELATHPTLSQPYLDSTISTMVQSTEEKLREERANLWRAKNLYRHFIGDESWICCERVESADDWDLFAPHTHAAGQSPSKKRKLNGNVGILENGVDEQDHAATGDQGGKELQHDLANSKEPSLQKDSEIHGTSNGILTIPELEHPETNGVNGKQYKPNEAIEHDTEMEDVEIQVDDDLDSRKNLKSEKEGNDAIEDKQKDSAAEESPPPPPRRITRALAAEANTSNTLTPPLSPATSSTTAISDSLLQPAALFLLPTSLYAGHSTHSTSILPFSVAHSGLPVDEILETRKLLGMYIQKQEEFIRGLENVLGKLIKSKRRRDQLWEWCKAEGHVGEMSDGEDWIDMEQWGLKDGELRKGKDEDEGQEEENVTATAAGGRKGKRRRARE